MDRSLSLPSGHQERNKTAAVLPAKYGARWLEPSKQPSMNKSQDATGAEFAHPAPVNGGGNDENVHRRLASAYSKKTWPPKPTYKSSRSMEENSSTKEKTRHSADGNMSSARQQESHKRVEVKGQKQESYRFYDHFQEPSSFRTTLITKNLKPPIFSGQSVKQKPTMPLHESASADSLRNSNREHISFDRPMPYVKPKFNKSIRSEMQQPEVRPQSENSFFDMVKDYRNDLKKNVDQRSPASKTMTNVLGPGLDAVLAIHAIPFGNVDKTSGNSEGQCAALKCWSMDKDRPRQSFAHFDWQSMTFSFSDVLIAIETLKRKNETTGASKAAALTERMHSNHNSPASSLENLQDLRISENAEDCKTNDVLGWCPFFCNEIGGEAEDNMFSSDSSQTTSCSQTPAVAVQLSLPETSHHSITNSPTHAQMLLVNHRGLSVLEKIGIDDDMQLNAVGFIQEYMDGGALYYRKHFYQQDHQNFFGLDEKFGCVAISIKREKLKETNANIKENAWHFRVIVRASELCTLRGSVLEDVISMQHHSAPRTLRTRDVFDYVCPEINFDCLKTALSTEVVQKQLMKVDEQNVADSYKIGIMYCKRGQTTEEEMYNNEHGSPALEEFLDLLGDRIQLKGFEKFRGGLDVKTNSTGKESYFTTFQGIEIMFHISTLLPYTGNNVQQLLRKRHIGNDIVTIVFQEPDSPPFSPQHIRSHFQHLFVVVRVHQPCSNRTSYRIAVTRSQDIPAFGPRIPKDALFPKSETFREFLLTKLLNGERAARSAGKFKAMSMNTRQEYLRDLAVNHCTQNGLDGGQKFTKFSLTAASRRVRDRDKVKNKISTEELSLGALEWHIILQDCGAGIPCMLGISDYMFCLIRKSTNRVIFSIPCQAIIGWSDFSSETLHLYYGRGERIAMSASSCASCDWKGEVKMRLQTFSFGSETKTKTLRRNVRGQLGFHINYEGIVMDVEINGYANHVGLTQGSRLVEICKVLVVTMTHDEMLDLLRTSDVVTVIMIPPLDDGTPRRCSKSLYHVSPVLKMFEIDSARKKDPSPASSSNETIIHSRSKSDPAFKSVKHNKSLEDITQALAHSLNLKMNPQTARDRSQASSTRNSAASTPTMKMNPLFSKRPLNYSASVEPSLSQHHTRPLPYHHQSSYDSGRMPQTARSNHFTTIPLKKSKDKHFMGSSQMKHSTSTESGLNLNYDYENKKPTSSSETFLRFKKPQNFKGPFHSASATNSAASTPTTKVNSLPSRDTTKPSVVDRSSRQRSARPQGYDSNRHETVFSSNSDSNHFTTIPLKKKNDKFFPFNNGMKHSTSTESGLNLSSNYYEYENNNRHMGPDVTQGISSRRKRNTKQPKTARAELMQFVEQKHKDQPIGYERKKASSPPVERRRPNYNFSRQLTRAMSDESICGIVHNPGWRKDRKKENPHDATIDPLLPLPNLADSWEQIVDAANTAEELHEPSTELQYNHHRLHSGQSDYSSEDDNMFGGAEHNPRSAASISPILPLDTGSSEEGYEPLAHISSQSDADMRLRKIEDALKSLQTQLVKEQKSKKKILREVERLRKDNLRLKEKANSQTNKDVSEK